GQPLASSVLHPLRSHTDIPGCTGRPRPPAPPPVGTAGLPPRHPAPRLRPARSTRPGCTWPPRNRHPPPCDTSGPPLPSSVPRRGRICSRC
ncbi:ACT domain-containing protein, partial [Dysosmobacter welbionis]